MQSFWWWHLIKNEVIVALGVVGGAATLLTIPSSHLFSGIGFRNKMYLCIKYRRAWVFVGSIVVYVCSKYKLGP